MAKKLLLNNELNIGDEELDPTYNYYVFNTSLASGTRITLQNYRAGDTTDWNGLTDWGDGCIDSLLTHKYAENGVYTVKTKYMINKLKIYLSHDITSLWDLKKTYKWIYIQNRNRLT